MTDLSDINRQIEKLEEQRQRLLDGAKIEALEAAQTAVDNLNKLGYKYKLVESDSTTRTRRTGVRDRVLQIIKSNPGGIAVSDIHTAAGADDKSSKQSVSNALSALKKSGQAKADGGVYTAI